MGSENRLRLTCNGERALGIAQFMPRTAMERQLVDPLDPVVPLPAKFLRELRREFGIRALPVPGPQRERD